MAFEEDLGDLDEAKLAVAETRDDLDKKKGELAQIQVKKDISFY